MPIPTPFHEKTKALCHSYRWKDWAGYYAVCSYDTYVEREYFALRHAAGLIDVTPLFKYEVHERLTASCRVLLQLPHSLHAPRVLRCDTKPMAGSCVASQ